MKTDAAKTDFLKKAQAHAPQAPPGYKPKVGEQHFWRMDIDVLVWRQS